MAQSKSINYYDILGVSPDATPKEIELAYEERFQECHPDRNQSKHAAALRALLDEAYEVLLVDPERRAGYDIEMGFATKPPAPEISQNHAAPSSGFWMPRGFQWVVIWLFSLVATAAVTVASTNDKASGVAVLAVWFGNGLLLLWAIEARRRHKSPREGVSGWVIAFLLLAAIAVLVGLSYLTSTASNRVATGELTNAVEAATPAQAVVPAERAAESVPAVADRKRTSSTNERVAKPKISPEDFGEWLQTQHPEAGVDDLRAFLANQPAAPSPPPEGTFTQALEENRAERDFAGQWTGVLQVKTCSEVAELGICDVLRPLPISASVIVLQDNQDINATISFGQFKGTLHGSIDPAGRLSLEDKELNGGSPQRVFINNWSTMLRPVGATMVGTFVWNIANAVFATYELRNFQRVSR